MIKLRNTIYCYFLLQNSNILSAVLCLIKELDAPSLEVAEMAIRCRMEELDDWDSQLIQIDYESILIHIGWTNTC